MKIGMIGVGNVGSGLGKIWVEAGHEVFFSYSRDPDKLAKLAQSLGAKSGTPREAVTFGEVVVLTVPWGAVGNALAEAGDLTGKILFSTVNALKPDFSGLEIGTDTSAAEWIAERAPGALVIESLVVNAEILQAPSRKFGEVTPTTFYCGDDAVAKALVSKLLADAGIEGVDAGPLTCARLMEPTGLLVAQLGYALGLGGNVALKLLRR